ncbi:MAG: hypothetical protein IT423_19230 [Pirellulaceae bacterium]|nr:hypothetical protein [Pirellulaceae bacterium]
MGKIHEAVKTFNSTVRTVLAAGLVGILGAGGFYGYSEYSKHERALATANAQATQLKSEVTKLNNEKTLLNAELKQKIEQLEKLETSLRLLKTDQRLARLEVLGLDRNAEDKVIKSRLQFIELSPSGDPISTPKKFELPGDLIYIDNWVIKFDDAYVEKADIQRGTSLCLFKRIFSEQQKPSEGFQLDEIGMRPQAYGRGGQMSAFEKQLWTDFWQFANDPVAASKMGIRAANGEAVSIQVREGKSYAIELRASGGLSITPVE